MSVYKPLVQAMSEMPAQLGKVVPKEMLGLTIWPSEVVDDCWGPQYQCAIQSDRGLNRFGTVSAIIQH